MNRMSDSVLVMRLDHLLEEVRRGILQVPDFQRGDGWSDEDRLRLMDSIWQGLPIGSLLVWRTPAEKGIRVRTRIGPCKLPEPRDTGLHQYLLDGFQRVGTLYVALMSEGEEQDAEGRWRPIYFDLDPPPGDAQRFRLHHGGDQVPPTWVPLSCLLSTELFFQFRTSLIHAGHRDLLEETRRLQSRFRDYDIPVVCLVSEDQDRVMEAFTRLNSPGQPMDEGDLVDALTVGEDFRFNDELATVLEQLAALGWGGLDRKTLLAALKALWDLDLDRADARALEAKVNSAEGRRLLAALPDRFGLVAELLRGWGVYGPAALPYSQQLVALLRVARDGGEARLRSAEESLRKWFFWTAYDERFTGMTSGRLRDEFERVEALTREPVVRNWYAPPHVERLTTFRPNAVRSRVAVLVMAIAGDREAGGDELRRRYGAQGMGALHRLFPRESACDLANHVLAQDDELRQLRDLAKAQTTNRPSDIEDGHALTRHLMPWHGEHDPRALIERRTERLCRAERDFVESLGGTWEQDDTGD